MKNTPEYYWASVYMEDGAIDLLDFKGPFWISGYCDLNDESRTIPCSTIVFAFCSDIEVSEDLFLEWVTQWSPPSTYIQKRFIEKKEGTPLDSTRFSMSEYTWPFVLDKNGRPI